NVVDPKVGYARGRVITGEVAEAQRQQRAYAIVRDRFARFGDAGVFNLTGLIRAPPRTTCPAPLPSGRWPRRDEPAPWWCWTTPTWQPASRCSTSRRRWRS